MNDNKVKHSELGLHVCAVLLKGWVETTSEKGNCHRMKFFETCS